jgi:hypothetical protein
MVNIIKCYSVNVNKTDLLGILKYQRIKKKIHKWFTSKSEIRRLFEDHGINI